MVGFHIPDSREPWPARTDAEGNDLAVHSKDVKSYLRFTMISPETNLPFHPIPGETVRLDIQNTWRHWNSGVPLERPDDQFTVMRTTYIPSDLSNHYDLGVSLEGPSMTWDPLWFPEDTASKMLGLVRDLRNAEWEFQTVAQRDEITEYARWWEKEFATLVAMADGGFWQMHTIEDIHFPQDEFVDEAGDQ